MDAEIRGDAEDEVREELAQAHEECVKWEPTDEELEEMNDHFRGGI
jgi:hypothetical protein